MAAVVDKPWGHELIWAKTERYVGKTLFLNAGESLSLQFHKVKDEAWYVLGEDALERFPERGDHESSAFPELAAEGRLRAFRHEGLWLTVNTPKELRVASDHVAAHPEWLAS